MTDINIINSKFTVGASAPFNLIHISDVHLTESDEDDDDRIKELSLKRRNKYPFSEYILSDIEEIVNKTEGHLLITGDMTDFISKGNYRKISEFSRNNKFLFVGGNHDFRDYGGMEYDVEKSRDKNIASVQNLYSNDIRFSSVIINGVNIVCVDNCYYRFEHWQLERLKSEVSKGLPIILCMHVPLYTEDVYNLEITCNRNYASLICVPEEKMKIYPTDRYIQQIEDEPTRDFYDFVLNENCIKLIISGHIHKNFESVLPTGITQVVTDVNTARIINIR